MNKKYSKSTKPRNPMWGAIAAFSVAIVFSVIAIVSFVIAASNQTVTSNLSVSYYANNVAATVTGSYQKAGDANPTTMTSGGNNSINFYATEARTSRSFNSISVTVDAQNPYVLFIYSFSNNATRDLVNNVQGYDVRVSLANNATISGFTTYYYTTASAPTGTLTQKYTTVKTNGSTSLPSYQYASAQNTIYYMMLVEITNVDYDASYADSELGGISWTLDHIGYKDGLDPNYDPNDYVINNDGVLTAYEGSSPNLVIPNTATSINTELFKNNTTIESVSIPSSVTSVGNQAFSGCTNLESVVFESGSSPTSSTSKGVVNNINESLGGGTTTTIGTYAFQNCIKLATLILPNNLTAIPNYMCYMYPSNNTYLTSITIPNSVTSIGSSAFYCCSGLTSITIPNNVTSIGSDVFCACRGLTSITIPNSVTSIGQRAFSNCSGLTSVTIGSGVTSIRGSTFDQCSCLTSITIPNSVTSIGSLAFQSCYSLTSITIPNSVTSIVSLAFQGCVKLYEVYNLSNLTFTIGSTNNGGVAQYAKVILTNANDASIYTKTNDFILYDDGTDVWCMGYEGSSTSITIPNNVTKIVDYAFYYKSSLTNVTIPNSVTSIGNSAFYNCRGLTSITIPNNVTSIGSSAFQSCYGLTSITIPNSVTSIGDGAFSYCRGLTSATIGSGVTSITGYAFYECGELLSVTIGSGVTSIGNNAFWHCYKLYEVYNLSSLTFTIGSSDNGRVACYAKVIHTSANDPSIYTKTNDFILYNDGTDVWCMGYEGSSTSITIPNGVTKIVDYAFYENKLLTSVTIPNSVTSIGSLAFQSCYGLTSITIPNSVTSIGYGAFQSCSGLTSVTINGGSIGQAAFFSCSGLTSVTIGSSVTSIGNETFYGCSGLTSVIIPNSVTYIGYEAFRSCSNLTSVTFADTSVTWYNYGQVVNITNPSTNASALRSSYSSWSTDINESWNED